MENTNHEPIKSKNIDCRRFLNSDYIMFGCILTINCYILLVVGKITDGIDVFFKSLSCLQGAGILLILIAIQALIELYVRYINRSDKIFLISRVLSGGFIIFTAYMLAIITGASSGYDDIIRNITSWNFYNLATIEFMFFCFTAAYERSQRKRCQNKSSDGIDCKE